ncbi:MAG: fasciclin domain-containing protein [Bacteroidota bacterium]|nr:fasciclin domain-containing protein [Bacteroidota bacterium]
MKKKNNKWLFLVGTVLAVFATSCSNDEWDEHYSNTGYVLSDESLSEYIQSQSTMSTFYKMMTISGYDSVLNSPETYTVWVPTNEALAQVDLTDTSRVRELVQNHISRFNHPTSGVSSQKLYMLSKKFIYFTKSNDAYYFGSSSLTGKNISTKNGIIHTISGYESYEPSIWEAIGRINNIDSLASYFNSLILTDQDNVTTNYVLKLWGAIDNEDSTYTVLFPTNKAWSKAFDLIKSYYNCREVDGGATLQTKLTRYAIAKQTVFRGKIDPFAVDSMTSTFGKVFHNPSNLFLGATRMTASNGVIYLADSLRAAPKELWHDEIMVEAENSLYGRSSLNSNVYTRNSEGTGFVASDDRYIKVDPTASSDISKVSVTFPIPNTLSAKYNIYCVFIPECIEVASSNKPYVANFYLDYYDANGNLVKAKSIAKGLTTNANKITKLYVGQFQFPFCNIWDGTSTSNIVVKLKVENSVKVSETTTKSRTMRIDCIILEPVDQ